MALVAARTAGRWCAYPTAVACDDGTILAAYRLAKIAYQLTCSAHNVVAGATYTCAGNTYTVTFTANGTTGPIFTCDADLGGGGGTLTKTSGAGDATIVFSATTYAITDAVGGDIYLVRRTNGVWGSPSLLYSGPSDTTAWMSSILTRDLAGNIILFTRQLGTGTTFMSWSADHGATWEAQTPVLHPTRAQNGTNGFDLLDCLGEHAAKWVAWSGNVLMAATIKVNNADANYSGACLISSDGITWLLRGLIADGRTCGYDSEERTFIRVPAGATAHADELVCVDRCSDDKMRVSWSADNGATWTTPAIIGAGMFGDAPVLAAVGDNLFLTRRAADWSIPLVRSADGGVTFADESILRSGNAWGGYTDMVVDGSAGALVLYHAGDYAGWLTSIEDQYVENVKRAAPTPPIAPQYTLTVGTDDLTDIADMDSIDRLMSERGEASCTFDVPAANENEVPSNALVRDAVVQVHVDGTLRWYGHIASVGQWEGGGIEVECAGQWDVLHQKEDYCKGFVETRIDTVAAYPQAISRAVLFDYFNPNISLDTDGQILFTLAAGSVSPQSGKLGAYLDILGGQGPAATCIKRVTFDWITEFYRATGAVATAFVVDSPWDISNGEMALSRTTDGSGSVDYTPGDALVRRGIIFRLQQVDTPSNAAQEQTLQIRNLKVYVDRTTAPRVDQAALEIWTDITGLTDHVTETIGSALTQCMVDPFTDGADAISQVLAKATTPPLCGVIHNQFRCLNRPTAPTDMSRLWVVSEQATPGLEWQVKPDMAGSKDYVALTYTQIIASPTTTPSGLPARAYYPTTPPSNTSRVALIDSGTELTDAEAALAAQQAYGYYHNLYQGEVVIPYVCHNGNGQESVCDHIECWDWVYNAGKANTDEAGPFLVSEVSHSGGIATLTIGATEGYNYESPYRMPTKGRYVGAHRTRSRELYAKWWRRTHKGKRLPKHHPKYKYGPWKDIAERYA